MTWIRKRLSYANVMATFAVFFVLGGGAYALSSNSVGTKQLKNKAVTNAKIDKKTIKNSRIKKENLKGNRIKDGDLTEKELADGTLTESKLADATLTGKKIADGSIGDTKISDYEVFGDSLVEVTATNGGSIPAARNAAPKIPLGSTGQLSIYGKCFRDTGGTDDALARVYVETIAAGAIFASTLDSKEGGNAAGAFLNPTTTETARELGGAQVADLNLADTGRFDYRAAAPDGTALNGNGYVAVKQGALTQGNGVYGDGNVCLFSGFAAG